MLKMIIVVGVLGDSEMRDGDGQVGVGVGSRDTMSVNTLLGELCTLIVDKNDVRRHLLVGFFAVFELIGPHWAERLGGAEVDEFGGEGDLGCMRCAVGLRNTVYVMIRGS